MNFVPRICSVINPASTDVNSSPKPIASYRNLTAYVLLGDPGMGKTTAFEFEEKATEDDSILISARDFISFDADDMEEWHHKTLFIDGLDEIRAGQLDPRIPFDKIRSNLVKLGKPNFRLSCRNVDWLAMDQKNLATVAPTNNVTILNLEPLDDDGKMKVLRSLVQRENPSKFTELAQKLDLPGLIGNPLTLTLLCQVLNQEIRPRNLADLYEQACRSMASEHNEEHLTINEDNRVTEILRLAGRVCAALLLCGRSGFSMNSGQPNDNYPNLADLLPECAPRKAVAKSKLFKSNSDGHIEPLHRSIAEYLAARYLNSLIEDGLTIGRLLSHLMGWDDCVIADLRGLYSWLVVLANGELRQRLLRIDPLSLALSGNIETLSVHDRNFLLDRLRKEPQRLKNALPYTAKLKPLIRSDMIQSIRSVLNQCKDSTEDSRVAGLLLNASAHADPLPELVPTLVDIAQDNGRHTQVKSAALDTLICYNEKLDCNSDLLKLFEKVTREEITDPDQEMYGSLLKVLYPAHIPIDQLWKYYEAKNDFHFGSYDRFWVTDLPSLATDQTVAELLDASYHSIDHLLQECNRNLKTCLIKLLRRGITGSDESISVNRLFNWLDVSFELNLDHRLSSKDRDSIKNSLEQDPELSAELLIEGLSRTKVYQPSATEHALYRSFGVTLNEDVYKHCANKLLGLTKSKLDIAKSLLKFIFRSKRLSLKQISDVIDNEPMLKQFLDRLISEREIAELNSRQQENILADSIDWKQKRHEEMVELKNKEYSIKTGNAPVSLLYELADVYLDFNHDYNPKYGRQTLLSYLENDDDLLGAVLDGFDHVVERDDLPNLKDIISETAKQRFHLILYPLFVGLEERNSEYIQPDTWWDKHRLMSAICAYFIASKNFYTPPWFQWILSNHPLMVGQVIVLMSKASFQRNIAPIYVPLHQLAHDADYKEVARYVCIPILRSFPIHAPKSHLGYLVSVLCAAIQYCDRVELSDLIAHKLDLKSMPSKQRVIWIACGCALDSRKYKPKLEAFFNTGRIASKVVDFAKFFKDVEPFRDIVNKSNVDLNTLLIRHIGMAIPPHKYKPGMITERMQVADIVYDSIQNLTRNTSVQATTALDSLCSDSKLTYWFDELEDARFEQRRVRSESLYIHPSIKQVLLSIDGGIPANPADLAAIISDCLDSIEIQLDSGATSIKRLFWNEDSVGMLKTPKPENSCTAGLELLLSKRIHSDIRQDRESFSPNDNRPDLRISFNDFYVPIEAKKNKNQDLWTALQDQLIAKYTSDPITQGYGIYVVYWFGISEFSRVRDQRRFSTAEELKTALIDHLTEKEQRRIRVHVLNLQP